MSSPSRVIGALARESDFFQGRPERRQRGRQAGRQAGVAARVEEERALEIGTERRGASDGDGDSVFGITRTEYEMRLTNELIMIGRFSPLSTGQVPLLLVASVEAAGQAPVELRPYRWITDLLNERLDPVLRRLNPLARPL